MSLKQIKGRFPKKKCKPNNQPSQKQIASPSLRQRYYSFIFSLKLSFIMPFVILVKHYGIRDDFLQIYSAHVKEMYRNPRLMKPASMTRVRWERRISDVREASLKIDPHAKVNRILEYALEKYRLIKELLGNFLEWLMVGFFLLFAILHFNLIPSFEHYQTYVSYLAILPILLLITLISLYKYLLAYDTQLFHMINSKLAYNRRDVYLHQRYPRYNNNDLIAMVIWNHSLANYTIYTAIFSMLCIKMVSKRLIYRYLFRALKEFTPKFLEDYSKNPRDINKIRKTMYAEWRNTFKKWWKDTRTSTEVE